ncbi:MAG TPA: hypothetical protein VEW05_19155 [Candidatus Polarisedimenticolia bacterium]|nr:hypothetical protein [Candidatus Polarisedimenticolia bacterium]
MSAQERRAARRLIMKVPLRFRPMQETADPEHEAASMNICNHGVYFATDRKLPEGGMIQVHLKMPREVVGEDVAEWCFTGRVAHVELLGPRGDKLGVGVQFLYYEVPRPSL